MPKNESEKNSVKFLVNTTKRGLTVAGKILIELIEQCEDYNYLYFHGVGYDRSVRDARYAHDAYEDRKKDRERKQAIKRLRQRKLIILRKEGDRVVLALTRNGKIKALEAAITASKKYFSDKKICLVSFDFPEAARAARDTFRWFLKRAGFKYVQGSVWSTKKDVAPVMRELVSLLRISNWVEVYTASQDNLSNITNLSN
jgi:virulence-associated protein VapD